jgi:hypothetical protein
MRATDGTSRHRPVSAASGAKNAAAALSPPGRKGKIIPYDKEKTSFAACAMGQKCCNRRPDWSSLASAAGRLYID